MLFRSPAPLSELGINVPSNVKVKVLSDDDNVRHLAVPPAAGLDASVRDPVSDEELEGVTGGVGRERVRGHGEPDAGGRGWWNDSDRS